MAERLRRSLIERSTGGSRIVQLLLAPRRAWRSRTKCAESTGRATAPTRRRRLVAPDSPRPRSATLDRQARKCDGPSVLASSRPNLLAAWRRFQAVFALLYEYYVVFERDILQTNGSGRQNPRNPGGQPPWPRHDRRSCPWRPIRRLLRCFRPLSMPEAGFFAESRGLCASPSIECD